MKLKSTFINKEFIYTLLLFFILFTPNIFVLFYFKEISGSISMLFAYFLLSILVWIIPLVCLNKKAFFRIGLIFLLFSPLEVIFVKSLGIPLTQGFMEAVYRTTYTETIEQISSHLGYLFFYLILIVCYLILITKIKNVYLNQQIRGTILFLFLLFNIILFIKMFQIHSASDRLLSEKLSVAKTSTLLKYNKIYPINLVVNSMATFANLQKSSSLEKQLEYFSFYASSENPLDEEEIYILVIGETARYSSFHLNGYERKTSPNLDTIQNVLSFSNVYSAANLTSISVPFLITRSTPEDQSIQNKEKTILEAFKEAGYFSAWFANQSNTYPTIKRLKDNIDFFKEDQVGLDKSDFFDHQMVPELKKLLKTEKAKKFIVIHSLGSHFRYNNRYPKDFERFVPTMKDFGYNDYNLENKEKLVNSYDNSIFYTDYFLSLLIESLKMTHKKAILLYVSDHGENLFDEGHKIIGHGTSQPTKYEYHIPYFIWFSNEYQNSQPQKINNLKNNLHNAASSTSTFHTLIDLANIKLDGSEDVKTKSLASEDYQIPNERSMVNSEGKIIIIK